MRATKLIIKILPLFMGSVFPMRSRTYQEGGSSGSSKLPPQYIRNKVNPFLEALNPTKPTQEDDSKYWIDLGKLIDSCRGLYRKIMVEEDDANYSAQRKIFEDKYPGRVILCRDRYANCYIVNCYIVKDFDSKGEKRYYIRSFEDQTWRSWFMGWMAYFLSCLTCGCCFKVKLYMQKLGENSILSEILMNPEGIVAIPRPNEDIVEKYQTIETKLIEMADEIAAKGWGDFGREGLFRNITSVITSTIIKQLLFDNSSEDSICNFDNFSEYCIGYLRRSRRDRILIDVLISIGEGKLKDWRDNRDAFIEMLPPRFQPILTGLAGPEADEQGPWVANPEPSPEPPSPLFRGGLQAGMPSQLGTGQGCSPQPEEVIFGR